MNGVVALGFDFDHTLGIDNKLERVAFLRLLELLISDGGRPLGTLDEETTEIDELLAQQRSGAFSIDSAIEQYVRARLAHADAAHYIPIYKRFAIESVDQFVVPLPGARPLLDTLHERGVATAILTNGWSPLQEKKAARVGFRGPVIVSETLGAQKPSARAFAALLDELGVPAMQAWYVGDNPASDVGGSLAAGMRAVWLDAESMRYPSDVAAPTLVIHSLGELLDLLPGPPALA